MPKKKADKNEIKDEEIKKQKASKEDKESDAIVRTFDKFLDNDEKILKVIKPNKLKVFASNIIVGLVSILVIALICVLVILMPGKEKITESDIIVAIVAPISLLVVTLAIDIVFSYLYNKNTYYAVTTKRLIVYSGVAKHEFRTLEFDNVSTSSVYVSWIDKVLGNKTGTIRFACNYQTMNSGGGELFNFLHISNPSEEFNRIQEIIKKEEKTAK